MLLVEDTAQTVAEVAANGSEEAPALPDQAASDILADAEPAQSILSEHPPADVTSFEDVDQSAAVQQPLFGQSGPQQTELLHVCLGPLPDAHASCKAFYFTRNQPGKLTLEDMDSQIDCGILSEGPSLKMLQQVKFTADVFGKE